MKKWKIYVGIFVVMAVLCVGLCVGDSMEFDTSKADDLDVKDSDVLQNTEVDYVENDALESNSDIVNNEMTDESSIIDVNDEYYTYNKVIEEEKYIAKLVSERTATSLGRSNWEECLEYLRNNYTQLKQDPSVDMNKVDSYVYAYTIVEMDKDLPSEGVNKEYVFQKVKYDPKKVTAYTDKWWDSRNPKYINCDNYGGDCANFVSQALYAGGKPMKGTVVTDFRNWFSRSSTSFSKISSTWRGADAFGHYWRANAKRYKEFSGEYFTSREAFEPIYQYTSVGDAISFLNDQGRPYHTVIVSYKNRKTEQYPDGDKMIDFASHTSNNRWRSLYGYLEGLDTSIRVYDMY